MANKNNEIPLMVDEPVLSYVPEGTIQRDLLHFHLDNATKCSLLKQLVLKEAERGFAPYLYELVSDVEQMFRSPKAAPPLSKETMVSWVAALCHPVYIFELGYNAAQYYLDMFIVIDHNGSCSFKELESYIHTATRGPWSLHFTLCQLTSFLQLRKQGNLFHIVNCNAGNILYKQTDRVLESATDEIICTSLVKAKELFNCFYQRGKHFFEKAALLQQQGANELACFLFHQAAEQALRGLAETFSGIHYKEHSIKYLLHQCSRIYNPFSSVFHTTAEKEMLAVLEASYIQARYDPAFSVEGQMLSVIAAKTAAILQSAAEYTQKSLDAFFLKIRHETASRKKDK